ncbi:MAG: recombinase family protein, partial [Dehalococcoidia bacterium]
QQEFDGTSLDTQEAAARAYAADHGYTVAARHVYREAHSGADLHERAHLTALRTAARAGEFDIVICHAVDRLSRNQAHLYIVAEELERAGVRLEFVTEDFADSAVGKFIRSAKALAAEVEREKFRERSERGKRERVRLGKLMHGKWPVYGYDWRDTRRGAYVADPATAPIVQRVFREALAGTPTRRIATGLTGEGIPAPRGGSRWEPTTVLYILNNRMYTGEAFAFRTKRVKVPGRKWGQILKLPPEEWVPLPAGTVPPLVDAATFEAVQERLRLNKARAGRRNSGPESFLLRAGIARCGYCGYAMSVKRNPDGNHQYVCVRNSKGRGLCPRAVISTRKLDRAVWASNRERMTHPE